MKSQDAAMIPTTIRCESCGGLAREEARERTSDDEVAVRYACDTCRRQQTRRFHDDADEQEEE